jgi:hypothetical protein
MPSKHLQAQFEDRAACPCRINAFEELLAGRNGFADKTDLVAGCVMLRHAGISTDIVAMSVQQPRAYQ